MVYRIEVSPNNRAGCKNTECKNAGIKIYKGQMRFGSWIEGPEFQSWSWKHWGCVTPKQIMNLKKAIDDDATELDGYEDLPEDFQEKIRNAVRDGHVADEDWGGDAEMNRAGKNGYRTPASTKAKKEALKGADSPSPSKPPTKRGRVKEERDDEGAEQDAHAPKKRNAVIKKENRVKEEASNGGFPNEAQPARKGRKKSTKVKAEVNSEAGDEDAMFEPPAKKARAPHKASAAKKIKDEDTGSEALSDAPETVSSPPAKKARAPRKTAAKKIKEEEADVHGLDDAIDSAAAPAAKKTRAPRKTAAAKKIKAEDVDNGIDREALTAPAPVKKATALRKARTAKEIKSEDSNPTTAGNVSAQTASEVHDSTAKSNEEDIETEDNAKGDGEATEVAPKPKKGSKKAAGKAPKGIGAAASTSWKGNTPVNTSTNASICVTVADVFEQQTEAPGGTEKPKPANGRVTRSS